MVSITKREAGALLLITFLCSLGLFIRPSLFGWDGYATAAFIRFGWDFAYTMGWQHAALVLFSFFPDSLLFFKVFMFSSLFLSLVPIFLVVKDRFGSENAFCSVFLLLALSPVMLYGFAKLENELFAFPLICWGLYFLVYKKWLRSLLLFVVSCFFWLWPGYFLHNNILSPGPTLEQLRFAGLLDSWFLFPVFFFVVLAEDSWLRFLGLVFVGFFLWNAKLFLFLFFFVGLAVPIALNFVEEHAKSVRFFRIDRNFVLVLALFCCIGVNCGLIIQQPTPTQAFIVKEAVLLSQNNNYNLYNDWEYGYWLWYEGIMAKNNPGSGRQIDFVEMKANEIEKPFMVLTDMELSAQGCELTTQHTSYFGRRIKLWKCQ